MRPTIKTEQYEAEWGGAPHGLGNWAFHIFDELITMPRRPVTFEDGSNIFWVHSATFAEAKALVTAKARALGSDLVEVLP